MLLVRSVSMVFQQIFLDKLSEFQYIMHDDINYNFMTQVLTQNNMNKKHLISPGNSTDH